MTKGVFRSWIVVGLLTGAVLGCGDSGGGGGSGGNVGGHGGGVGGQGGAGGAAGQGGAGGAAGQGGAGGAAGQGGAGGAAGQGGAGGAAGQGGAGGAAGAGGTAGQSGIGPAGGTVTFEGVTVVIPPGALTQFYDIAIARANGAVPPAGTAVFSPIYQFTPSGLSFIVPATVSFAGNYPDTSSIYWTQPGSSTNYDALMGAVVGGTVTASISHFSLGAVAEMTSGGGAGGGAGVGGGGGGGGGTGGTGGGGGSLMCQAPNPDLCGSTCVNLQSNVGNCGSCGNLCPNAVNGTPICTMGACNYTCTTGFADCNSSGTDGCETSTGSDIHNCGSCGTECPGAFNAIATCQRGACAITCNVMGYSNCDGVDSNGCETNTQNDANNCGGCGIQCFQGQACSNGMCGNRDIWTNDAHTLARLELNGDLNDSSGNNRHASSMCPDGGGGSGGGGGAPSAGSWIACPNPGFTPTPFGQGVALPGTDPQGFDWSAYAGLLNPPFTIEMVFQMSSTSLGYWKRLFLDTYNSDNGWYIGGDSFYSYNYGSVGAGYLNSDEWHYVAITSNILTLAPLVSTYIGVWIDGVYVGSLQSWAAPPTSAGFFRDQYPGRNEIGSGAVDGVRISDIVRSPTEIGDVATLLGVTPPPATRPRP